MLFLLQIQIHRCVTLLLHNCIATEDAHKLAYLRLVLKESQVLSRNSGSCLPSYWYWTLESQIIFEYFHLAHLPAVKASESLYKDET